MLLYRNVRTVSSGAVARLSKFPRMRSRGPVASATSLLSTKSLVLLVSLLPATLREPYTTSLHTASGLLLPLTTTVAPILQAEAQLLAGASSTRGTPASRQ